jgi:integrase
MLKAARQVASRWTGRVRRAGEGCVYRRCGCTDPGTGRQYGRACPRLAAGSGHGSWYVRLELPAGLDGRRRRIRRGGYPSRKAALEVLARLRAPRPGDAGARMLTVGDWLAHWLVTKTATAPSTVRGYAAHVRLYLDPYLGEVLLGELSAAQVQAMFTAIIRQHHALGTPVSAATLTRIRATLRAALNAAIRRGLISENPAAQAELPRARRPRAVVWTSFRVEQWRRTGERPAVAVWTAQQTAQFLASIEEHRLYAVYHLIALRGLRRGEAAGLRWRDVDLDGATAMISQQLQQYDGRLVLCPPKTARSERAVALDRTTVAVLRAPGRAGRRPCRARRRLPRQRVRVHLPQRRPDGPRPALADLPPPVRRGRAAAGPAARPAARRGHPRTGCRGRPESRPGHAWPFQHRAHRRYLHLGASRGRPQGRRGHRHADHRGGVPGPRHRPAPPARAARPWRRKPGIWQPSPPRAPSQSASARGHGHQQESAQRDCSGAATQRSHDDTDGKRASGHTVANLCPYQHADKGKTWGETPGQYGCAARDSNPEPAD